MFPTGAAHLWTVSKWHSHPDPPDRRQTIALEEGPGGYRRKVLVRDAAAGLDGDRSHLVAPHVTQRDALATQSLGLVHRTVRSCDQRVGIEWLRGPGHPDTGP